jgi:hypothetical protein
VGVVVLDENLKDENCSRLKIFVMLLKYFSFSKLQLAINLNSKNCFEFSS